MCATHWWAASGTPTRAMKRMPAGTEEQPGAALVVVGGGRRVGGCPGTGRARASGRHCASAGDRSAAWPEPLRSGRVGDARRLTDWSANECRAPRSADRTRREVGADDIDAARRAGETVIVATGSRDAPRDTASTHQVRLLTAPMVLVGANYRRHRSLLDDPIGGPIAVALAEWLAAPDTRSRLLPVIGSSAANSP